MRGGTSWGSPCPLQEADAAMVVRIPLPGLTVLIVGGAAFTVNPPVLVAVPPGVVTETSLAPAAARAPMVMLAVI